MNGRTALVTGGSRGIGLAIATRLRRAEAKILAPSRSELDLLSNDSIDAYLTSLKERVDILVNNAGILIDHDKVSTTDVDLVRTTLETNLLGPWRMCKAFIPLMKKNNYGRIVNVSSGMGAFLGGTAKSSDHRSPAYSVSKTGLNALTLMMASELRGTNILVNAACPGHTRTDMGGPNAPRSVEEGADTIIWLATLPDRGPTGEVFLNRKRIDW